MRCRRSVLVCVSALSCAAAALAALPGGDEALEPLYSRQRTFSIPFRIDEPAPGEQAPEEVQLHFRTASGSWHLDSRVPPDKRQFVFRAPADGAYEFMVRTRDDRGRLFPGGPPRPELRVIVDTESPHVELHCDQGQAGELTAHWSVNDAHLDVDSFTLEYDLDPAGVERRTVATDPLRFDEASGMYVGQATWTPQRHAATLVVRATAADLAGNAVTGQATIGGDVPLDPSAGDEPSEQTAQTPWMGASNNTTSGPTDWPPTSSPSVWPAGGPPTPEMASRFPGAGPAVEAIGAPPPGMPNNAVVGAANDAGSIATPTAAGRGPALSPAGEELVRTPPPAPGTEAVPPPPPDFEMLIADRPDDARLPIDPRDPRAGYGSVAGEEVGAPPIERPFVSDVSPAVEGRAADQGRFTPNPSAGPLFGAAPDHGEVMSGSSLPPGVAPRMVNSTRFELEYEIDAVGPAGVAKVELWGTEDGGATWTSFGVDPDNRSPIVASVPGEGMYGFRIVVESGSGLRGPAPSAGEEPDVWIGVDITQPIARLTTAELGTGPAAGELTIRWEAADDKLASQPVALAYSVRPGGPWTTIASNLDNSGEYVWRLDNRAPDRAHLRLEVRDEAGNVALFESSDAVPLDPVRPRGTIRAVRPRNDSSTSASGPRWIYNLLR